MRDNFSKKVIDTLARRAGYKCSNPDCRRLTVGANEEKHKSTLVGEAAHITGASIEGPRFDSLITQEQRSSINNGIWLCSNCATLIDKDKTKFTISILNSWKEAIEKETSDELRTLVKNEKKISGNNDTNSELTFQEKAEEIKRKRQREQDSKAFLASKDAIQNAIKAFTSILEKLRTAKNGLEDPKTGFSFGTMEKRDEHYGIGFNSRYIRFKCLQDYQWDPDINKPFFSVTLLIAEGHHGINYTEKIIDTSNFRFTRNQEGNDGWLDPTNQFFLTDDLFKKWMDKYLSFIE